MLQSPGQSPLHISSPSPSISQVSTTQNLNDPSSSSSSSSAKHPAVLDEDTYVEALEKIIERDYFLDISKLRDRLDWVEAIKTSDPVVIREAQLKILERRAGTAKVQRWEFIMDEQHRIKVAASSSNSSSMASPKKYDVFLSFRGEDTRRNFTSHLYKALNEEKIKTYIDDQLEKGDDISLALFTAIENSRVSIVIFSENYASSKWCLRELNKILECKKVQGQIVIPIFYNIDPSHVRKQTGSYEQAFAKHEGELMYNKWKTAMTEAANFSGWDSQNFRTESEFLKVIIEDVLRKLAPRSSHNPCKELVGIEEKCEQVESLLKIGTSKVKILGIWGMGGIGKTTLAKALHGKLSCEFEGHCFLAKVGEKSEKLETLRDELFSMLLENKNHGFDIFDIISRLQEKKVLIVLDDVTTSKQLEILIKEYDFLGPGSKVIVTTRNKQIFGPDDIIYPIKGLSSHHSLELFCLTVFGEKQPKDGYEELSRRVVSYCKSVPLALKVMGGSLRNRSIKAWESELIKLQKIPKMEIHKVLKLSYDSLDFFEKDIFLDIACLFKGKKRDSLTGLLEAFGFFPECGIEVLLDKALITISYDDEIEMHDLLQELGRKIVHQESDDPRRGSRLCSPEEVHHTLKHNKGTDVVEGIFFDLHKLSGDLCLSPDSFAKMTNLRSLQICNWDKYGLKVNLPNGLESLSGKLRYLMWDKCCLESLPPNFCAEQLVEIRMPHSKLKKLWDGIQNLANLKEIDLSSSLDLIEIPNLSKARKLEIVDLRSCESLHQLHPSILSHPKLTLLDLRGCIEIESLNLDSKSHKKLNLDICSSLKEISITSEELKKLDLSDCREIESLNVNSKPLKEFYLNSCSSLKEILMTSEEMTTLHLCGIPICALPSSMSSFQKLTYLDLSDCRLIESLNLHSKFLKELNLSGCSSLKEISFASEEMTKLKLSGTIICALPSSMTSLSKLAYLDLSECKVIERLHLYSKSLEELNLRGCTSLKEIFVESEEMTKLDLSSTAICALSSSMLYLPKLTYLDLSVCRVIERLVLHSKSLKQLNLSGCSSLKEILIGHEGLHGSKGIESLNVHSKSLNVMRLDGCLSLRKILVTSKEITELDLSGCSVIESLNLYLQSLKSLKLNGCSSLNEISLTPEEMIKLKFSCTTICALPSSIDHLLSLEVLDLSGSNIERFPTNTKIFSMLRELILKDCRKLVSLPELSSSLRVLWLDDCRKLVSLPKLPPTLYMVSGFNCMALETTITQQLVLQHMLQSYIPYLHQHHLNLWVRDYFAFPGDHVMDKCLFRTIESLITIPCLPISHIRGFIYCIILTKGSVSHDILVSIYQGDVKVWDSWDGWDDKYSCCKNPVSEHVIFWYHDISKYDRISEVYDHSRDITFVFKFDGDKEIMKGFGVFPVYATKSGFKLEICNLNY